MLARIGDIVAFAHTSDPELKPHYICKCTRTKPNYQFKTIYGVGTWNAIAIDDGVRFTAQFTKDGPQDPFFVTLICNDPGLNKLPYEGGNKHVEDCKAFAKSHGIVDRTLPTTERICGVTFSSDLPDPGVWFLHSKYHGLGLAEVSEDLTLTIDGETWLKDEWRLESTERGIQFLEEKPMWSPTKFTSLDPGIIGERHPVAF